MKKQKDNWVWWKHGVFYHIYPRSFYDSNNDGIGDVNGIIEQLDYLVTIGIAAIWISPMYESPMRDFGYDISNYRKIDPLFGSLDDFKSLLQLAHQRGIRIVMDLVMNHTSNLHPWFLESRSSLENPKRDWYIWQNGNGKRRPNNWRSAFGSPAWELDKQTGQYYLHSFLKEMPDLNWRNKDMKKAYFDEVRFWLDLGVDGFRLDVINMIVKDKKFRNNPIYFGIPWIQKHVYTRNRPKSRRITHLLRKLLDEYDDRMCVGEIYAMPPGDPATAADYLGTGSNSIHLAFDFSLLFQPFNARKIYSCLNTWYAHIPDNSWACNVLSNHDLFRSVTRYGIRRHVTEKLKVLAVLLLTIKGTPFVYYGEEIGMANGKFRRSQIADPLGKRFWPFFKGRDRARTPMQWTGGVNAGFSKHKPWLPVNNDYPEINVERESVDPDSVLTLYRRLIRVRNENSILQSGEWIPVVKGEKGMLVYLRVVKDDQILVILNFRKRPSKVTLSGQIIGKILVSTHKRQGLDISTDTYESAPYEGTVLRLKAVKG